MRPKARRKNISLMKASFRLVSRSRMRARYERPWRKATSWAWTPRRPCSSTENACDVQSTRFNILSNINHIQLHLQTSEKLGIVATYDEVETKLVHAKPPYTREGFQKRLKRLGITEGTSKLQLRRNLVLDKL